jgi:hypothetical protein
MRSSYRFVIFGALCWLMTAAANAQSPGCGAMEFSPEVMAKFPNAPRACLDIINREGEPYGVFKAKIARVNDMGNSIDVKFKLPDGTYSDTRKVETHPDRRVMVRGKETRVNNLVVGDELTAYVKVRTPVLALAPAEESTPPEFVPIQPADEPQQVAAAMPATGGYTSLMGLTGAVLWMLATILFVSRRDRRWR